MPRKKEKFITFYIAQERFGLPIMYGSKFLELDHISAVPQTDKNILGLSYDSGHLITALDLRKILKLKSLEKASKKTFVIFEEDERHYGISIDQVGETETSSRVYTDRQKNIFKKYIKTKNKENIYILEPDEILESVNIYGQE